MHHPKRVLRHLKEFRRLGIQVAVDDFGTGYSCLGLMKRFPLHALKIDRSFVRNCATDQTNQALVAAIIRMGHALGLSVTAEGVETAAQLAYLAAAAMRPRAGVLFQSAHPRRRAGWNVAPPRQICAAKIRRRLSSHRRFRPGMACQTREHEKRLTAVLWLNFLPHAVTRTGCADTCGRVD